MSEINDLLAKIAEPETPEERDAAWNEVADRLRLMDAMHKELNALCDWGDESFLHAYCHIGNVVKNLRTDVRVEKILREKAEANYAFMVKKAADQSLDGYRELGARAAAAENEADRLRARLRETAQILIEAVGADGPMDSEEAARKASERIYTLRSIADEKSHEAGLYARRMGEAQKARGGIRSRLVEEGWVGPDKWSYCPYCGVKAPRPGLHNQGCPAHDKGGSR